MANCPNCAAPITSHVCEYCGTVHDDLASVTYRVDVLKATNNYIESQMKIRELYESAIRAMREYTYNY